MLNPHFRFMVREGDAIDPFMTADFDWGRNIEVDLSNFTEKEVDDALKKIVVDAMNDKEYQANREPCPPQWLRRPCDVIDEIGRLTPRIHCELPSNNLLSEDERLEKLRLVEKELEEELKEQEREAARLDKKSKRNFES
eukprot:CAMPEP_0171459550 /NCGR_PEP_ID=MMETSP0945-20130129/4788_1 /TAXON_ID=109269 /ORGANISM="Vaucheria litorea, Strain CCMP2940" /LENGTH=138 /DNA_ID=CAMNT_0011985589 /DNA_START=314 /DNA_END=730 /DNA_ORIENTATION=-